MRCAAIMINRRACLGLGALLLLVSGCSGGDSPPFLAYAGGGFVLLFVVLVLAGTRTEIRARRLKALMARERME